MTYFLLFMMDFVMIIKSIQGWTYCTANLTTKTVTIVQLINVAEDIVFLFVTKITNATEPGLAQVTHTADHHRVYFNISFCLGLQQDF